MRSLRSGPLGWRCGTRLYYNVFYVSALLLIYLMGAEAKCSSWAFCSSPLLDSVQRAGLFKDSKTFVDMPSIVPAAQLEALYFQQVPQPANAAQLRQFVLKYFLPAGSDVVSVTPTDWNPNPSFLNSIADPTLRAWAADIHAKWKDLVRVFNHSVAGPSCDSSCYSSLPTKYPFAVAGGRFREFYYWDSLWIMDGLLLSEMYETARGILLNFADLIHSYGFIPNGGRVYYLNRSQPPVFTLMVQKYYEATQDKATLTQVLPALDSEYMFWMTQRAVNVSTRTGQIVLLNIFNVSNSSPRPESYLEDFRTAQKIESESGQQYFYANIASGAETGWDFSSRWMPDFTTELETIVTSEIVPVDLNSILYSVELALSRLHQLNGDAPDVVALYHTAAQNRKMAIESVLWDPINHTWRDVNYKRGGFHHSLPDQFYASSLLPLWAKAAQVTDIDAAATVIREISKPLEGYIGGVPTSLIASGQQWDFPNAWPPLQLFAIDALDELAKSSGSQRAQKISSDLSLKWLTSNFCAWNATKSAKNGGFMFEKYDTTRVGLPGGGGEYEVQTGFGWTNGVALTLLQRLGSSLSLDQMKCPNIVFN